jgi:Major Facilitator Superfamily
LFIIEGAITVVIAFVAIFVLPNFPRTTKWLTEEERLFAIWRLKEDIGSDDWKGPSEQTLFYGFTLALKDIRVWVLTIMITGIVSAGGVTNFFPTVVQTLKFGTIETLLLTTPPYVLAVITTLLNAWHADRTGERLLHIILPLLVGVVAFIIAMSTLNTAARYVSMMLMVPGVYVSIHKLFQMDFD